MRHILTRLGAAVILCAGVVTDLATPVQALTTFIPPLTALPDAVLAQLGGYVLATKEDFLPNIRRWEVEESARQPGYRATRTLIQDDFNMDGASDLACLTIDRQSGQFKLAIAFRGPNGSWTVKVLRTFKALSNRRNGAIYTVMQHKPRGEAGLSSNRHSPLKEPLKGRYINGTAVSVWTIDAGRLVTEARFAEIHDLAHTETSYAMQGKTLQTFEVNAE